MKVDRKKYNMEISEKTRKSYKEIYRIIEHSSLSIQNKIPQKYLDTIYEVMDKDYEPKIDYLQNVNNQNLMPETYAMMALIYRNFICDKNKQKLLFEKERQERRKIEESKREKYNSNNIFKNDNKFISKDALPLLVEVKPKSFFQKITSYINKLFKIK